MRLILVRHGETAWNREGRFQGQSPVGLSEKGILQAKETARALAALKPTALYSSPLPRALMTAQEISNEVSLDVVPLEGIKEVHLGKLEGITGQEMRSRYAQFYSTWRRDPSQAAFPEGESMWQLQDRAWKAIVGLENVHPNGAVVVVSHNFAIRTILCRFMGLPLSQFHRLRVDLASIGVLQANGSNRQVLAFNERCHLSEGHALGRHVADVSGPSAICQSPHPHLKVSCTPMPDKRDPLERKLRSALERAGFLRSDVLLVVAVSGGPDSVALLHALLRLKERLRLRFHVGHLNHNFRGEEAEEDARFVAGLGRLAGSGPYCGQDRSRRLPAGGRAVILRGGGPRGAVLLPGAGGPGDGGRRHRPGPHRRRPGRDRAHAHHPGQRAARPPGVWSRSPPGGTGREATTRSSFDPS